MHEISHGGISTVKLLQISNSFIYIPAITVKRYSVYVCVSFSKETH